MHRLARINLVSLEWSVTWANGREMVSPLHVDRHAETDNAPRALPAHACPCVHRSRGSAPVQDLDNPIKVCTMNAVMEHPDLDKAFVIRALVDGTKSCDGNRLP